MALNFLIFGGFLFLMSLFSTEETFNEKFTKGFLSFKGFFFGALAATAIGALITLCYTYLPVIPLIGNVTEAVEATGVVAFGALEIVASLFYLMSIIFYSANYGFIKPRYQVDPNRSVGKVLVSNLLWAGAIAVLGGSIAGIVAIYVGLCLIDITGFGFRKKNISKLGQEGVAASYDEKWRSTYVWAAFLLLAVHGAFQVISTMHDAGIIGG